MLWTDSWVKGEGRLIDKAQKAIEDNFLNLAVAEATDQNGEWNIAWLEQYFTNDTISKIAATHPPREDLGTDRPTWNLTPSGEFSVSSAYHSLTNHTEITDHIWEIIWKWKGPQSIKMFMWLTSHKKLMTSSRRNSIFGASPDCHLCQGTPETIIHVLRDYPGASCIWAQLINPAKIQNFFRAPFEAWLRWNLTTELGQNFQIPWKFIFMAEVWEICNALRTA
ncbi:hypothetical protein AHAS_Ahas14G0224200 [Arachis hypogaea]